MIIAAVALDASLRTVIAKAPFAGVITKVEYVPIAAITGVTDNSRKVSIQNRGSAGLGTTEVAALTFATGTDGVAFDAKELTLSVTPANLDVAAGDVLAFYSETLGTGIADPGGTVIIEMTRDDA
jgi:hypothetical protein